MNRLAILAVGIALGACESSGGGEGNDLGAVASPEGSGSAKRKPGFADDIARQLDPNAAAGSAAATAGSGSAMAAPPPLPGSAAPAAGSAAVKPPQVAASPAVGSGSAATATAPKGGSAAVAAPATPLIPAAGSAAKPVEPTPTPTPAPTPAKAVRIGEVPKWPAQTPSELAKIKLQLGPNWVRDKEGPGTISFALNEPTRGQVVVFVFQYGFEDPSAPVDREAYKKWLGDTKALVATVDRQRGVTWYIEGADGGGKPVFRYIASYGPQKLICGGSLYRDAESNRLGDLRDDIILAAKKICESLAL